MRLLRKGWNDIADGFRGEFSRWGRMADDNRRTLARNRVYRGACNINVNPKFTLKPDAKVYTIGSCFARNVEYHLSRCGIPIADKFKASKNYVDADRANDTALFNRFNVPSIYYEALAISKPSWLGDRLILDIDEKRSYDAFFSPAQMLGSREGKITIRNDILTYSHEFLKNSGLVIITLGLSEAVFDNLHQMYLNGAPSLGRWNKKYSNHLEGHFISVDDAIDYLHKTREILTSVARKGLKIIVTVSPVPLESTFDHNDIIVSNALSKSTLRVAAEEFARAYDDVDYYPSYEMAINSDPEFAFLDDKRHVSTEMVKHIVTAFLRAYYKIEIDNARMESRTGKY